MIKDPKYRGQGIGSKLLSEAAKVYPEIIRELRDQAYTPAGARLVQRFLNSLNRPHVPGDTS